MVILVGIRFTGVGYGQLLSAAEGFAGGSRLFSTIHCRLSENEATAVQPLRAWSARYPHGYFDPTRSVIQHLYGLYIRLNKQFKTLYSKITATDYSVAVIFCINSIPHFITSDQCAGPKWCNHQW